jgi:hypothetical protein
MRNYHKYKGASNTPDGFWNFKTSVTATRRFQLTVIMHSDVWSLAEKERWSVQLFIKT